MNTTEVVQVLETHNAWRRGCDETQLLEPNIIGEAIDSAVAYIGQIDGLRAERNDWKAYATATGAQNVELKKQRDELLAALDAIVALEDLVDPEGLFRGIEGAKARAIIASVKGGA